MIEVGVDVVARATKLLGRDVAPTDPFFQNLLVTGLEVEEVIDRYHRALGEDEGIEAPVRGDEEVGSRSKCIGFKMLATFGG